MVRSTGNLYQYIYIYIYIYTYIYIYKQRLNGSHLGFHDGR